MVNSVLGSPFQKLQLSVYTDGVSGATQTTLVGPRSWEKVTFITIPEHPIGPKLGKNHPQTRHTRLFYKVYVIPLVLCLNLSWTQILHNSPPSATVLNTGNSGEHHFSALIDPPSRENGRQK